MEFRITIKDELGVVVCEEVPFDEDRLEDVSEAAGGLQDFVQEYKEKLLLSEHANRIDKLKYVKGR